MGRRFIGIGMGIVFGLACIMSVAAKPDGVPFGRGPHVSADQVSISTEENDLISLTLQEALDNELAVSVVASLPGSTWTVENKTCDPTYMGYVGQITFSETDDSFVIDSGRIAAFGIGHDDEWDYHMDEPVIYEQIGSTSMMIQYTFISDSNPSNSWEESSIVIMDTISRNEIVLLGQGGWGAGGSTRASILTRVQ